VTREEAVRLIESARGPADLFGDDAARSYRRLARLTHPDTSPSWARTQAAFCRLASLWQQHRDGSGTLVAEGDIANLYEDARGLLKITRDPADNDLIDREFAALTQLRARGDARFVPYIPRLTGSERQRDPATGTVRGASILDRLDGFVSLAAVRRAYPGGLDPRDAAWIWRRLLVALGFAHRAGVIHGAVLPPHVMIHPAEHGLVLVDWCYSVCTRGDRIPAIVARYRDWYPPEVLARQAPGPGTDIYLATRCMTDLVASPPGRGSAQTPERRRLGMFAGGCALPQPSRRPQDAWRLLGELDDLLERLYGPRRFRPFAMPAPG
jgi:serine/threonine protein kinase